MARLVGGSTEGVRRSTRGLSGDRSRRRRESMQAVRNWRALAGYQERVAKLREVVDHFEPRTLEVVARR
jgi:hypothetical protein